jgi:hypothetical protein
MYCVSDLERNIRAGPKIVNTLYAEFLLFWEPRILAMYRGGQVSLQQDSGHASGNPSGMG